MHFEVPLMGRNGRPKKSTMFKWFGAAALTSAMLLAGAYAIQGLALAMLIVAGVFVTLDVVPGLMWLATTSIGMPIAVILTGILVAKFISITSIVGMFALGFTLVLKTYLLQAARYLRLNNRAPNEVVMQAVPA